MRPSLDTTKMLRYAFAEVVRRIAVLYIIIVKYGDVGLIAVLVLTEGFLSAIKPYL